MPTLELDVLKPIDPSIEHSDDYPEFALGNVQVFYASNGKPTSLLSAYADTPLRVQGRLEAPRGGDTKYLVKKPFKPVDIEIRDVTRYSYGQTEDGETVVWALGQAGWHVLQPSRAYKNIFLDMVEAIEILHFVADIYSEPRKRGGGPTAQSILQEYAEDERFPNCNNPEHASKIFHKHRAFLIMCFMSKAQGIGWSNTPLYQYFKRHFPKDWEAAKARIEGRAAKKIQSSPKTEAIPSRPKEKPKQKVERKTSDAPKKDDNWWEATAIFEFMQKAVNQGAMHVGRITLDKVAGLLVKRYEIEDVETARHVLLVHAPNLCYIMDHPRRKNVQYFVQESIYQDLSAGHSLATTEIRRAEGIELRPRKDHGTLKDDISSDSDSSSSSIATPRRRPRRSKKGRLSVLRPKSAKFTGKGKGKGIKHQKGKGKAPDIINSESEEDDDDDVESDDDLAVDTPTQPFSPGKRKHIPDNIDLNPRKRAASTSIESEPQSPSSSSEEEATDAVSEPLPLRWRSGNNGKSASPALLPPIISSPLPEYTANGPGDSWICSFDGCSQKVYGVSTELGRGLIKEHLEDHAKGRQKHIGLLLSEEQRLRLPVNNLIKRIREMSEAQQPLFPGMGANAAVQRSPIQRNI